MDNKNTYFNFKLTEGNQITCCKDCKDRYVGCHSNCEEYKKQKEKYEEEKLKRNETRYIPYGRKRRYEV